MCYLLEGNYYFVALIIEGAGNTRYKRSAVERSEIFSLYWYVSLLVGGAFLLQILLQILRVNEKM